MPFYEYACKACGHQFDTLQKISDAPLTRCPACNKNQLQKLVSAAAFQLKGSGWYATDFKSKENTKATKEEETKPKESKEDSKKSTDKTVEQTISKSKADE